MARLVGIDIRATHVRVALLSAQYRGIKLLGCREAPLASQRELEETLRVVALPLVQQGEHIAVSISGDQLFIRDIEIPATAAKQLSDVVPIEIEAQVPIDFDELCFDYRSLGRKSSQDPIRVLAAATRVALVRQQIELVQRSLGAEAERIGAGPLPLGNLAQVVPELRVPGVCAILDVGLGSSDLLVLRDGTPVFARTLSVGAEAGGNAMISALRQSQAAWLQRSGEPFLNLFLAGAGPAIDGAAPVLSEALAVAVAPLPSMRFEGTPPEDAALLVGFEKAVALALSLTSGSRDLNLRRGALAYQHSYEFLKSKLPLLGSIAALIIVSFVFSVWARSKSLSTENLALQQNLAALSEQTIGEKVQSGAELNELLDKSAALRETDPQPEMDAFDVLIELSKAIDADIVHDIDEFDFQNGKVKVQGVVSATDEAEKISAALGKNRCFKDVKISKISQVVNGKRQKYSLAFDVACPGADKKADGKTAANRGARQP
jgi:general secretion pathway protein L